MPQEASQHWKQSKVRTAYIAAVIVLMLAVLVGATLLAGAALRRSGAAAVSAATASPTPLASPSSSALAVLTSTDWSAASYPLDCGGAPYAVQQVAYPVLPGTAAALVLVRCTAGAGSPPSGLYLFEVNSAGRPAVAESLLAVRYPAETYYTSNYQAGSFSVNGTEVRMDVFGYSAARVPRCCPDVRKTLTWSWNGSGFTSG